MGEQPSGTDQTIDLGQPGYPRSDREVSRDAAEKGPIYRRFLRYARETTFAELRALPDTEVVKRYDWLASLPTIHLVSPGRWFLGPEEYIRELDRRAADKQGKRLESLTNQLRYLTWVLALVAVATFGVLIYDVFFRQ